MSAGLPLDAAKSGDFAAVRALLDRATRLPAHGKAGRQMKLRVFCLCAGVVASIVSRGSVGLAQTPVPPPVPASLFVQDRFARAVKNQSSAPSYLMATIVNDTTGENKRVCIEGVQLFEAVRKENQLGRGREDWNKTTRLILDNSARIYHFTDKDAWEQVQPRYSPQMLAAVEEQFRPLSTVELAERFSYTKTRGFIKIDDKKSAKEVFDYCAAAAYVLTERGLLAGRGDAGNSLYVITPQMLAEDDKREQSYAEQKWRSDAEGRVFAARLPGYGALVRHFRVRRPQLAEYWSGFCFSVSLNAASPRLVNSIDWLNPVNKKTRKARYDWNQFLPIAAHVERLARLHSWLQVWKTAGPNRTIEAQMYGKSLHNEFDDDFQKDIVPAWKDAGLLGKPYCQLVLRWQEDGQGANATVYLPLPGSGEKRSLIVSSYRPRHATVTGPGLHWLDRLSSFHSFAIASVRQVVVVTPDGDWRLFTLLTGRSAHGKR